MKTEHGATYPFIIIHPDFATNFDFPALAELTDGKRIQPIWVFRGEFGGYVKIKYQRSQCYEEGAIC